jgi:hypothetical protein
MFNLVQMLYYTFRFVTYSTLAHTITIRRFVFKENIMVKEWVARDI